MKRNVLISLTVLLAVTASIGIILLINNPQRELEKQAQRPGQEDRLAGNVTLHGLTASREERYTLDTAYKPLHQFAVYYGELQYSGIPDYSVYDFMIVFDRNPDSVAKARAQGTKIFQYIYFGSRFADTDQFMAETKEQVKQFKEQGLADGVFLDECDIAYWDPSYSQDEAKQQRFYTRLQELTDYIRSLGMESVINGTRAFAGLGDYYLWESFQSYWGTKQISWDASTPAARQESEDGAVTYGRRFDDWTFEGTAVNAGDHIEGGSKGAIEKIIELDEIVSPADMRGQYDWVYTEWFGEGGNDETVSIHAWIGDSLPFIEADWSELSWKQLPKLWKGEPESWDGIGQKSKYLKLRFEFDGALKLRIDRILLSFDYVYPYWDMKRSNGAADDNPYMWNNNNSQLQYLLAKKNTAADRPVNILAHSYGEKTDLEKMRYTYFSSLIHDFYAWNYAQPMMQEVTHYEILEEPLGMLLKKEQNGNETTGYFTGATAKINDRSHTASLIRDEPAYYYSRPVTIDGDMSDWADADQLYANSEGAYGAYQQYWGLTSGSFASGTADNLKLVAHDDQEWIELEQDGTGTWVGPVVGADQYHYSNRMDETVWNSSGDGKAEYYIKYQHDDGSWSEWSAAPSGSGGQQFKAFQVKLVLSGKASAADGAGNLQQGVAFWGSSHLWRLQLSDDVNTQGIWVTDDSKYLYIRYKVAGQLDYSDYENIVSNNFYNVYIDSDTSNASGYKGSWWNTSFGAKYRLLNNGLYRWNESAADDKDEAGWEWVGTSKVSYKKAPTGDEIEFKIRKSTLGGLKSKDIRLYMFNEETASHYGTLIAPVKLDAESQLAEAFTYSQKVYQPKIPHGYLLSDQIEVEQGTTSVVLQWNEIKPKQTDVKAWLRTRSMGAESWNDWAEVSSEQAITGDFDHVQYAIGLYTKNGQASPEVSDIKLALH
ncbi:hypothetical protein [Paenibacillus sp. GCM10027626]|uniref:hypothetical protein n=1 Tax=Paenibacillus sp. GCM10027626 TaxID=3273411 RepID=UPI003645212A